MIAVLSGVIAFASLGSIASRDPSMVKVQLMGFETIGMRCKSAEYEKPFLDFLVNSSAQETAVLQTFKPLPKSQWPLSEFQEVGFAFMYKGENTLRVETRIFSPDRKNADSIEAVFLFEKLTAKSKGEVYIGKDGKIISVPCKRVLTPAARAKKVPKAK